jgi:hypothetical protein
MDIVPNKALSLSLSLSLCHVVPQLHCESSVTGIFFSRSRKKKRRKK